MTRKIVHRDRHKLLSRVRKIGGHTEAVERALSDQEGECADTLQLLVACRGAINGLMAEAMEEISANTWAEGRLPKKSPRTYCLLSGRI